MLIKPIIPERSATAEHKSVGIFKIGPIVLELWLKERHKISSSWGKVNYRDKVCLALKKMAPQSTLKVCIFPHSFVNIEVGVIKLGDLHEKHARNPMVLIKNAHNVPNMLICINYA